MRIFSYRNKRALRRALLIALLAVVLIGLLILARISYLGRYAVYSPDGVYFDKTQKLQREDVPAAAPAADPEEYPFETILSASSGEEETGPDTVQLQGYYISTTMLANGVDEVRQALQDADGYNAVLIDVKSPLGNFYYSTDIADAQTADADISACDALIRELTETPDLIVVARVPAFSDPNFVAKHYSSALTTTSGDVTLHVPRLKGVSFETAIIERYRRRESSVEEALIEMYLAGVSVRRVEDITEALWGSKVSPATISELNKKAYVHIEDWRNRPLQGGRYPYVYVDGIYLRRNWGGEYENVAILVAIAVNEDGFREVLGAAEGMKEDKASWINFFQWLRGRGLDGVKLIVGDKCMGMLEAVGEVFPDAKYQRCTVHFYRNVFSVVPKSKVKIVAKMLKAIHAQESKKASREKAKAVVAELRAMKLKEAAKKVEDGIEETLTYCDFPSEHWTRIRTNNVIERLNREIRRRTRVVGTFPDSNSALMLVCARLRHVAGTQWGCKKYMNMKHLEAAMDDASIAG